MLRQHAFVFRLREHSTDARAYARFAGCVRFVRNKALAIQQRYYRRFGKYLSALRLDARLPRWKKRYPFLKEAPAQALQQTLRDLEKAWKRFFESPSTVGRPQFKNRNSRVAFRLPQGFKFEQGNQRLFVPKAGWVRLRVTRPVWGTIKNVTLFREGSHWFVSLQAEADVAIKRKTGTTVGVDVGAVRAATATDGSILLLEQRLARAARHLRRFQRALSRKQKGSNRRQRARNKLARVHRRLAAIRKDALNKYSRELVRRHAAICLEGLDVQVMTASGGSYKAELNRRILAAGWAMFRQQCKYKAQWRGRATAVIDPAYTSQRCAECGHIDAANRRSQSEFICKACGHTANADDNAARNIRVRGVMELLRAGALAVAPADGGAGLLYQVQPGLSHVESAAVQRSKKREPAEVLPT